MRLPFLIHLLDAVAAMARPRRIVILGSSSLLPQFPELGEPGHPLEVSLDADLLVEPVDDAIAGMLKDAVGEESGFQQQNGYYANILRPAIAEVLPAGWEARLHPVDEAEEVTGLRLTAEVIITPTHLMKPNKYGIKKLLTHLI